MCASLSWLMTSVGAMSLCLIRLIIELVYISIFTGVTIPDSKRSSGYSAYEHCAKFKMTTGLQDCGVWNVLRKMGDYVPLNYAWLRNSLPKCEDSNHADQIQRRLNLVSEQFSVSWRFLVVLAYYFHFLLFKLGNEYDRVTYKNQSTVIMKATSSAGSPTTLRTMTMVTRPAWGIPAAPMLAAVAVMLNNMTRDYQIEKEFAKRIVWSSFMCM